MSRIVGALKNGVRQLKQNGCICCLPSTASGAAGQVQAELLGISARSYEDLEHGINLCSAIVLLRFLSRSGVNAAKLLEELNTLLTSE